MLLLRKITYKLGTASSICEGTRTMKGIYVQFTYLIKVFSALQVKSAEAQHLGSTLSDSSNKTGRLSWEQQRHAAGMKN
jgi:hypothetical protein